MGENSNRWLVSQERNVQGKDLDKVRPKATIAPPPPANPPTQKNIPKKENTNNSKK